MGINLTHEAMQRAQSDVRRAAERIAHDRKRADLQVTGFLGSGWTGVAADAFADAWEDWKIAADQVELGLDSMAELLAAVHRDLLHQDEESQRSLDQISQRIVDRLG
ncbi:MAG: WXG100 family type VII secretion target [Nocardioides sp.]